MFKHWMEIVHNLDNCYLDWLFQQNVLPLRELTSIMSGNCKGITLQELFGGGSAHDNLGIGRVFHCFRAV